MKRMSCVIRRLLHVSFSLVRGSFGNVKRTIDEIYLSLITNLVGKHGVTLRYRYYKKKLGSLGKGSRIDVGVCIQCPEMIHIGDNVHLDRYCLLVASPANIDLSSRDLKTKKNPGIEITNGMIIIGNDCHLSQYAMIFAYGGVRLGNRVTLSTGCKVYSLSSLSYNPNNPSVWSSIQPYSGTSPTIIGPVWLQNNVWLGINTIVVPGVIVGEDSFVRSNSVVTKSFGINEYIAGDPAIFIKSRFE